MVRVKTSLAPAKKRKNESGQRDNTGNTCNSDEPSETDSEPRAPMNAAVFMKCQLRIVVPCCIHRQTRDRRSDEANDAKGAPTVMNSTHAYHLTRTR